MYHDLRDYYFDDKNVDENRKTHQKLEHITLCRKYQEHEMNEWIQSFPKTTLYKNPNAQSTSFASIWSIWNSFFSFVFVLFIWGVWYRGCSRYKYAKFENFKNLLIGSEFRFTVKCHRWIWIQKYWTFVRLNIQYKKLECFTWYKRKRILYRKSLHTNLHQQIHQIYPNGRWSDRDYSDAEVFHIFLEYNKIEIPLNIANRRFLLL